MAQSWLPYYRRDVETLERMQKRFTNILPALVCISYEETLDRLALFSRERWRLREDLIQVYRIKRGTCKVESFSPVKY